MSRYEDANWRNRNMADADLLMYQSPINRVVSTIAQTVAEKEDSMVIETVQSVGIDVDKAELLKALQYDRNQYDKGKADGIKIGRQQILNDMFAMWEEADCTTPKSVIYDCIVDYLKKQNEERWDAIGNVQRAWHD